MDKEDQFELKTLGMKPSSPAKRIRLRLGFDLAIMVFLGVVAQDLTRFPVSASEREISLRDAFAPADLLKEFISNPPFIEELVYRKKLAPEIGQPIPIETGLRHSTNYQHALIRWEPGSFVHRFLSHPDEAEVPKLSNKLFVFHRDQVWHFGPGYYLYGNLKEPGIQGRPGVPRLMRDTESRDIGEVLNMGILHISPGTIRWHGDAFKISGEHPLAKIQISGVLHRSEHGRAEAITVEYLSERGIATHSIRYRYAEGSSPPYLPCEIHLFLLRNGREIELGHYRIERFRASHQPLNDSFWRPDRFITANQSQMRLWTNAAVHVQNASGNWIPLKLAMAYGDVIGRQNAYVTPAFYFSVLFVTLICAVLGVRAWKINNHNKETENV